VSIPSGYTTSENVFWDFAVLDFNVPCGLGNDFIGNTTGWRGIVVASSTQLREQMYILGYPAPGMCGTPAQPCNNSIWNSGSAGGALFGAELYHKLDATSGEEGAGMLQLFDPPGALPFGGYIVGVHSRGDSTRNYARVYDSTLSSFLVGASDDF
jgi:hypothetical protein